MNLPIEMISVCGVDGALTPLRFRLEDETHCLQTVAITRVISCKPIQYAGIDALQYLCKAVTDGRERLFELRYTLRTHCWTLFQMVY